MIKTWFWDQKWEKICNFIVWIVSDINKKKVRANQFWVEFFICENQSFGTICRKDFKIQTSIGQESDIIRPIFQQSEILKLHRK